MRKPILTPMRLLCGIVAFTVICMLAVAAVTDHLADMFLSRSAFAPTARIHLISEVTQALKRAEACRAGYGATGDATYLTAYRAAAADVDFSMNRLVGEDTEVTNKLTHAAGLRDFVHEKLGEIGKSLEFTPAGKGATVSETESDLVRLQKLMDSLAQEETADINGELDEARLRTEFHRDLLIAVTVINVLFLAGAALCAAQIGKIYSLVTICAWSKRVQYGDEWIPLEEFMWKRFGIRMTHGISKEEYDKWTFRDGADAAAPAGVAAHAGDPEGGETVSPKAAA